ncbi:MAG: pilus assembly protein, partial [Aquificaceae bacterium]
INPLKLEENLTKAFSDILKRSSSGATVATLSSRYQSSAVVIQPGFHPEYPTGNINIKWLGMFRGFWFDPAQNLREDTTMDKILTLLGQYRDKVFSFFFDQNKEIKAAVFDADPNENPSVCSNSTAQRKDVSDLKPTLQFDCRLAITGKDDREIYFNKSGQLVEFKQSNVNQILPFWQVVDSNLNSTAATHVIEYLRGKDYTWEPTPYVMRKRVFDVSEICKGEGYQSGSLNPWKLGPIVYSTPNVAGNGPLNSKYYLIYEDQHYRDHINSNQYKNRRSIVYVGSNIGMLHFFRIGFLKDTGNPWQPVKLTNDPNTDLNDLVEKEEFAFIPENALPYMLWYGREDYCSVNNGYIPILDYRVDLFDASFGKNRNPDDNKDSNTWETYLFGSMGVGGKKLGTNSSSVFLLRLTQYLNDNTGNTRPELMWEVKLPDNSLATSYPSRIRIGDKNKVGKWYFIIGSGPLDPNADSYNKFTTPKLYIMDARNGNRVKTLNVPVPSNINIRAAVGDLMEFDVDSDYQDDVIYFGVYGYTNNETSWGALYRIALKTGQNTYKDPASLTDNDIKLVLNLDSFSTSGHAPPVFAATTATKDEEKNLWVYVNTGLYLSPTHNNPVPYTNYIIGFKDPCWDSTGNYFNPNCSAVISKNDLADARNVLGYSTGYSNCNADVLNFSEKHQTKQVCGCDSNGCSLKSVVLSTNAQTDMCKLQNAKKGWYYELDSGALAYSRPIVIAGVVYSMYFKPSQDVCTPVGESYISALNYKTGLPPSKPTLLVPGNTDTNRLKAGVAVGYGAPPLGEAFRFIRTGAGSGRLIAQISSGAIINVETQLPPGRFVLWIEK